jgi:hypothetical protein
VHIYPAPFADVSFDKGDCTTNVGKRGFGIVQRRNPELFDLVLLVRAHWAKTFLADIYDGGNPQSLQRRNIFGQRQSAQVHTVVESVPPTANVEDSGEQEIPAQTGKKQCASDEAAQ